MGVATNGARQAALLFVFAVGCGDAVGRDAGPVPVDAAHPHADAGAAMDASAGADAGARIDASDAPNDAGDGLLIVPACAVLEELTLDALQAPAAGSDAYWPATAAERAALGQALRAAAMGDASASTFAADADYDLCRGEGEEADLLLFAPRDRASGRARVVLRRGAARDLVVEVPHPFFDSETLPEGVAVLREARARSLIVAGTHRCASVALGCDGAGAACGAYRISDAAHYTDSAFQEAHVSLAEAFPESVSVSLHGFGNDGVRLSDGTNEPTSLDSIVGRVGRALDERVAGVTVCNDGVGLLRVDSYCGTTNVQGRYSNGSPDACSERANTASGRFLHLEQSSDVRADPSRVAQAFAAALPL